MIDRVLLALDGSPRAERAIPYVVALVRAFGAETVLLRVVEGGGGGSGPGWTDPVAWRLERSAAVAYLEGIKERFLRSGLCVDVDVGVGHPAEEILESAHARRADLVALTTHGRGEAKGVAVAGTAHKVVAGAKTSLLLVPASEEEPAAGPRRIVVGLDGSPRAEWALCLAARAARSAGLPIVTVYVVPAPEVLHLSDTQDLEEMSRKLTEEGLRAGERYLTGVADRLDAKDVALTTRVLDATPNVARALTELASEEPETLLVLGAHGRSPAKGCAYGSVAQAVLTEARHPVLVLRDAAPPPAPLELAPGANRRRREKRGAPAV